MPVRVYFFPDLDFRWVRYDVTLTTADVIAVIHQAYGTGGEPVGRRSFVDLETVETVGITFSDMNSATQTAVENLTAKSVRIRLAVFAPTEVTFGIARIYQTLMDNSGMAETLVTRDRREVAPFLGLAALPDLDGAERIL